MKLVYLIVLLNTYKIQRQYSYKKWKNYTILSIIDIFILKILIIDEEEEVSIRN